MSSSTYEGLPVTDPPPPAAALPSLSHNNRPLFANSAQTPLYKSMSEYAYTPEVQELLQKMTTDMFCERPEKPLDYMIKWLLAEKQRRDLSHK